MKKRKLSKNRDIISSGETKDRLFTKKNTGLFIVGGLVLLMIFSIFAVSLDNGNTNTNNNKIEYNGYELTQNNGLWRVNINGANYDFEYSPKDVENIASMELSSMSLGNKIYITFNPDEFNENSQELLRLKQFFYSRGISVSLACIKEQSCSDLPIVNCNSYDNTFYFKNGNETKIYKDNKCFILESKLGEEPIIINRFIYGVLGIIGETSGSKI